MGRAVFPPCSLAWVQTMIGQISTSSKRTYTSMPHLPGLLLSVSLDQRQAAVNTCLCWSLPNTHRGVWLCLLLGPCSFLLGSAAHTFFLSLSLFFFFCPPRVSISPVLWEFCNKVLWTFNQIPWGSSVLLSDPQLVKPVAGPRTFTTVWELLWYNCSLVCGLSTGQPYSDYQLTTQCFCCFYYCCFIKL